MSTAPIVTIAWQQPTKWIGVEEHVRRGRIRNRGDLTAGMTVQVMYKKGWYKAKVINPDPLQTRKRTKKSCTCCTSPVKHSHHKGRDRKKGTKSHASNSESEYNATVDGVSREDTNTDTDSKTEGDAKLDIETDFKGTSSVTNSEVESTDQKITETESDVKGEDDTKVQRNLFADLQMKEVGDEGIGDRGVAEADIEVKQQNDLMQPDEKQQSGEDGLNVGVEKSDEIDKQDAGEIQGGFKDDQNLNDNNNVAEPNGNNIEPNKEEVVPNEQCGNVDSEEMMEKHQEDTGGERRDQKELDQSQSEQISDRQINDQVPDARVIEQVSNEQAGEDETVNESTTREYTVTSEQIANEHMYSQRIPVAEDTDDEQADLTIDELDQTNKEQSTDDKIEGNEQIQKAGEESVSEPSGENCDETPAVSNEIPPQTAADDRADDASVDSEAADTNVPSDVNVVYLRPSDIHMSTEEDDDSQNNNIEQNEQENNEKEKESVDEEGDSVENQHEAMELEMARPDEPLGQIKISEPISLAGTVNEHQEQPLELTTQKQKQPEENRNKAESDILSKQHLPGSKPIGDKPAEIKHKSKGLVAHQTTLPSGRPGPIILTMKSKKPKHKKSKKKNKHRDKEKSKDAIPSLPTLQIRPAPQPVQPQKPSEPQQRIAPRVEVQPNVSERQLPPVSRQQQSNAPARHPQAAHRHVQSPPNRGPPQSAAMMRSPNVIVSADGTMRHTEPGLIMSADGSIRHAEPGLIVAPDGSIRHMVEPIRHIEPPRAHMPPPPQQQQQQRGPAPGSRSHSQSSQPSPTQSPPNAHHHPQWYPVNMPPHQHHHPRMGGPGPPPHAHPGHPPHMSPSDFANIRARHPSPYHSGLPPYVEASFAGAPQFIRGSSPRPMGNSPSPAEAAYIRAQSLAHHCHHPHWQPNGPPHFVRDPRMHGPSVLRVPRYGHPPYPRMPGDMPPGAGRPPPLIPAPGPQPQRSIHPVSIHKTRPEGVQQHQPRSADIANAASPNSITPRSSTSESVQSLSPQNTAQKRPREPTPGELENILAQQFQEGSDGERVIGVAELIELRNALRRHHGFTEEPPAKSPRLETVVNGNQAAGFPCPPMLASVGLQPRPPSGPINPGVDGPVVISPALLHGNSSSSRMPLPQVSIAPATPHQTGGQPHIATVAPQPNHTENSNRANAQNSVHVSNPPNAARHWVAEAQQLYPHTSVSAPQTAVTNYNDPTVQPPVSLPSTTNAPAVSTNRTVPPLTQIPKAPQTAGRSAQRSGRKQKTPHRRPTVEDSVVIKSEPLSPGYEAEETSMDTISVAETDESREQVAVVTNQTGSDSLDSVESEEPPVESRSSGSGPISQLQTLCTRLSSSRTPIIPSQSLQRAPPHIPSPHLAQQNEFARPASIQSGHSSPANTEVRPSSGNPEMRAIPPLMQDTSGQLLENQREQVHILANEIGGMAAAVGQPLSPVEHEPTSSGMNESAPSPDTSTAAKVDRDLDVTRRLSFLEREMGIVKSWLWEIRTILTSRTGGLRKGLPKCTDIGDGNVLVGSGEHTITMARADYLDCWDKTENAKDLVVKLISKVFTEEELAMSSFNGGMIRSTYKKRLADDHRFNAILAQAEKEYGAGNLEDRKAIREAVNNKCRKKAFKFRQQEAITQRIAQQYQMYKQ